MQILFYFVVLDLLSHAEAAYILLPFGRYDNFLLPCKYALIFMTARPNSHYAMCVCLCQYPCQCILESSAQSNAQLLLIILTSFRVSS